MSVLARSLACALAVLCAPVLAVAQSGDGADLPLDDSPLGQLSARVAYNTEDQLVLGVGFATDRLFGADQSLRFDAEATDGATRLSFNYLNDRIAGGDPRFGLRLFRTDMDAGEVYAFDSHVTGVVPRLSWDLGETGTASVYALYSYGEISGVAPAASLLLRNDAGGQNTAAIGGEISLRFPGAGGLRRDTRIGLDLSYGETSRNHEFLRYTARLAMLHAPESGNVVLRSQLRVGGIETLSGTSSIGDRFMLGDSSLRGFAFGGFGPRDLAAGNAALGGNQFALARLDAQFPNAFGDAADNLTPGVFVDVGSLWGLDDVAGGPAGANPVDDGLNLRASVGLTLRIQTGLGPIELYAAHPFEQESYDLTQVVGLSFSRRF